MRWPIPPKPPEPRHGDIRRSVRFAWYPKRVWNRHEQSEYRVWLEKYWTIEAYFGDSDDWEMRFWAPTENYIYNRRENI